MVENILKAARAYQKNDACSEKADNHSTTESIALVSRRGEAVTFIFSGR